MPINVDEFMPNIDPDYADIIGRIPSGWGYWIDCGPGWKPLILELHNMLKAIDPDYELHQCKEKFGGLRYYTQHAHNDKCLPLKVKRKGFGKNIDSDGLIEVDRCLFEYLIEWAEMRSVRTCEVCGDWGRQNNSGWIKTLCEEHGGPE